MQIKLRWSRSCFLSNFWIAFFRPPATRIRVASGDYGLERHSRSPLTINMTVVWCTLEFRFSLLPPATQSVLHNMAWNEMAKCNLLWNWWAFHSEPICVQCACMRACGWTRFIFDFHSLHTWRSAAHDPSHRAKPTLQHSNASCMKMQSTLEAAVAAAAAAAVKEYST